MIESAGPVSNFLSSTITQKKGLIPIRSLLYRKNSDPNTNRRSRGFSNLRRSSDIAREDYDSCRMSADRNLNIVKEGNNRTSVFYKNVPELPAQTLNANVSVSTDANSNVFVAKPNLIVTLHKLGAASRQGQMSTSAGARNATKLKKITHDYTNILFDETRVRFKKEDYEDVVDINLDQHMNRIYSQGFRDPDYFARRSTSTHRMRNVLSEEEVRSSYNFRLPALISSMENPNTAAIHVLGSTKNDINFITDEIDRIRVEEDEIKQVKEEIRADIERMKEEHQKELDDMYLAFKEEAAKMMEQLTEDFHDNQNTTFKLVKEISRLEKEKIIVQGEIDHLIMRMHVIEDNIFGKTLFTLEPTNEDKQTITQMNLRTEDKPKLSNTKIVH